MRTTIHIRLAAWVTALLLGWNLNVHAQVYTTMSGEWENPAIWSNGQVPAQDAWVQIRDKVVSKSKTLFVGPMGKLEILEGGMLNIENDLNNQGTVLNHDSLLLGGLENQGLVANYKFIQQVGTFENQNAGEIQNFGTIYLDGDLVNRGTFYTTGLVYMEGDLENWGLTECPAGYSSYFDVCGSAKHHNGAEVRGTNYLCVRCGGSYDQEPGRIGDFIEQCSPFAVVLDEFRGELAADGQVHLSWLTASETNTSHFVVERAMVDLGAECTIEDCFPSNSFVEIGQLPAAGNSHSALQYAFVDPTPGAGLNFYRLRIVDLDGTETYSPVVDIAVDGSRNSLQVFPNPSNALLQIRMMGQQGQSAKLNIYAIDGKLIYKQEISFSEPVMTRSISVCDYAAGVYIVEYSTPTQRLTKKVVFSK